LDTHNPHTIHSHHTYTHACASVHTQKKRLRDPLASSVRETRKDRIFKHTKITYYDQLIFFMDRAYHNKATHKVSHFYHTPTISYEFQKFSTCLYFRKNKKPVENFSHSLPRDPLSLTRGPAVKPTLPNLDCDRAGGYVVECYERRIEI
jgi:hypothetical protein